MKKLFKYFLVGFFIVAISSIAVYSAIQRISGLAVAQTSTQWNNLRDAAAGDNLINGILAGGLYIFDGTNWDRARGDTTNGLDVDVTRVSGSVTVTGNKTPSDNYANPTDAINSWSLLGLWDGSNWDRIRGDITNGLDVDVTRLPSSGSAFYAIKRDNIAASSVNLAFGFTSSKVAIEVPSANTDEICIDWIGGTAVCPAANTAGDDRLTAGTSILLDDYAVTSISVISASGTQTIYVRAWQ